MRKFLGYILFIISSPLEAYRMWGVFNLRKKYIKNLLRRGRICREFGERLQDMMVSAEGHTLDEARLFIAYIELAEMIVESEELYENAFRTLKVSMGELKKAKANILQILQGF